LLEAPDGPHGAIRREQLITRELHGRGMLGQPAERCRGPAVDGPRPRFHPRRRMRAVSIAVVLLGLAGAAAAADTLRFVREGALVKSVEVPELMRACRVSTVDVDDPNYGTRKRYRACPLADVLALAF